MSEEFIEGDVNSNYIIICKNITDCLDTCMSVTICDVSQTTYVLQNVPRMVGSLRGVSYVKSRQKLSGGSYRLAHWGFCQSYISHTNPA